MRSPLTIGRFLFLPISAFSDVISLNLTAFARMRLAVDGTCQF